MPPQPPNPFTLPPSYPPADAQISHPHSLHYWSAIPATINGMLGGYPQLSATDLKGSAAFLAKLRRLHPHPSSHYPGRGVGGAEGGEEVGGMMEGRGGGGGGGGEFSGILSRGVDCGTGIGRVTAGFLSSVCEVVDAVEPIESFAAKARVADMKGPGRVGEVYVVGLQDWVPEGRYDVIWAQWCLGYLRDGQVVEFLRRCKGVLGEGGWVVVKENVVGQGGDCFDEGDRSVTRSEEKWRMLFREAGLRVVRGEWQRGFPRGIYGVRMWGLRGA